MTTLNTVACRLEHSLNKSRTVKCLFLDSLNCDLTKICCARIHNPTDNAENKLKRYISLDGFESIRTLAFGNIYAIREELFSLFLFMRIHRTKFCYL